MSDIYPANLSDECALKLAATIVRHPLLVLRVIKQSLRASQEVGFQAGLVQERQLFTLLSGIEDRHEDASASLEKRIPEFKGC